MNIDHVLSNSKQVFSISVVDKELCINNAYFMVVQLEEQLVAFSIDVSNQDAYFRISREPQIIHFVSTFKMMENTTYFQVGVAAYLSNSLMLMVYWIDLLHSLY